MCIQCERKQCELIASNAHYFHSVNTSKESEYKLGLVTRVSELFKLLTVCVLCSEELVFYTSTHFHDYLFAVEHTVVWEKFDLKKFLSLVRHDKN